MAVLLIWYAVLMRYIPIYDAMGLCVNFQGLGNYAKAVFGYNSALSSCS